MYMFMLCLSSVNSLSVDLQRPRYERDGDAPPKEAEERPPERAPTASVRAETPEEGEI